MDKLKPCPFCGGEAKVQRFPRNYSVYCTECGSRTMLFKPTEKEAIEVWNRRVNDVRPVKEGKWVKARGSWCTPGGDPVWECSECGKGVHVYGIEHGTYGSDIADGQWVSCPNCGAKMGGIP